MHSTAYEFHRPYLFSPFLPFFPFFSSHTSLTFCHLLKHIQHKLDKESYQQLSPVIPKTATERTGFTDVFYSVSALTHASKFSLEQIMAFFFPERCMQSLLIDALTAQRTRASSSLIVASSGDFQNRFCRIRR